MNRNFETLRQQRDELYQDARTHPDLPRSLCVFAPLRETSCRISSSDLPTVDCFSAFSTL
jgi:hypothetical protein